MGEFAPSFARIAVRALHHRGPDGSGIYENADDRIALAHTRLSIIDLSPAAAQPMASQDGRFVLAYNGEIYNFKSLRDDLVACGHQFRSTGDTEVLLQGLIHQGIGFLNRVNGIFAFAFWDRDRRSLILARDQLGIKPLYFTQPRDGVLVFASEIKAFFAYDGFSPRPDPVALQQHLGFCHASQDRTAFANVKRLLPGHYLEFSVATGRVRSERYWNPPFDRPRNISRERARDLLKEHIQGAVHGQMVSDVPVGAFLSGGLDSSFITVHAAEHAEGRFTAFTSRSDSEGPQDSMFDSDLGFAKRLADALNIELVEVDVDSSSIESLPNLIYHLDEPLADPAVLTCHLLSEAARERGIKVLLSGQGGDELFCGYPRYLVTNLTKHLNYAPDSVRRSIAAFAKALPGGRAGVAGGVLRRVRRALSGLDEDAEHRFLRMCASSSQHDIDAILSPAFRDELSGTEFIDGCIEHMRGTGLGGLQQLQDRDLSIYLPNHNLLYTDKICMASGIEARVPLLDMKIVTEAVTYPYSWQLSGFRTKALLRDAAVGCVPTSIIRRSKAGFGAPFRSWMRGRRSEMWGDLLSEESVNRRGWFSYSGLVDVQNRCENGSDDLFLLQWAVISIELWARTFLDSNPLKDRGLLN